MPALFSAYTAPGFISKYQPGPRLIDGETENRIMSELFSCADQLTATPGGGQANALQLNATVNNVSTVGTAADSVKLPPGYPGREVVIFNSAATNSMQVFGFGSDTINGVASGTGVAQAAGKNATYYCISTNAATGVSAWFRVLSA